MAQDGIHRLAVDAPDLYDLLRRQPEDALRAIALAVATLAAERRPIVDARLDQARAALAAGAYGDGPERARLDDLVWELDRRAWALQAQIPDGDATDDDYGEAFMDARAAAAVWMALDGDPQKAAIESTYEAQSALDDLDRIRATVRALASPDRNPA